jgi:hypothetical protein
LTTKLSTKHQNQDDDIDDMNKTMAGKTATIILHLLLLAPTSIHCFATPPRYPNNAFRGIGSCKSSSLCASVNAESTTDATTTSSSGTDELFHQFTQFLKTHQSRMIQELEDIDGSGEKFSRDGWGAFADGSTASNDGSGGITRVIQNGSVIEKGACSLTVIQRGKLSKERAETISARQNVRVGEGDVYSAAALSVVLHTRNPFVPVSYALVSIDITREQHHLSI